MYRYVRFVQVFTVARSYSEVLMKTVAGGDSSVVAPAVESILSRLPLESPA